MTRVKQNNPGKFNFVVAAPWPNTKGSLCTYTYGSEVQYGTIEDAQRFLEYVKSQIRREEEIGTRYSHQPASKDFAIYKIVPFEGL